MASIAAGTLVGHKYRLEAPIGRGGMASVWRATHTTLESSVAVKFLEMFGPAREKMTERFLQEAKLAAQLEHRNVVRVLDFGVLGDGQPFMVMELLSGETLADRLESDDPPSTLELLELIAQVLGGLAAVHDQGIVHRDMKPENIFLVRDADGRYPKLVDFGISKGQGDARMTDTGAVVGTPAYMSPEQARGLPDIDARTDLFSVGVILREAFTGELPFECEHVGDILIRVATEDVRTLEIDRPDLPQALIDLVDRALARDREQRWPDARTMRAATLEIADRLAGAGEPSLTRSRLPSARLASNLGLSTVAAPAGALETGAPVVRVQASGDRRLMAFVLGGGALGVAALALVVVLMLQADPPPPAQPPERAETREPTAPAPAEPAPAEPAVAPAEPASPVAVAPSPAEASPSATPAAAAATRRPAAAARSAPPTRAASEPPDPDAAEARRLSALEDARRARDRALDMARQVAPPREETGHERPAQPAEEGGFLRNLDY